MDAFFSGPKGCPLWKGWTVIVGLRPYSHSRYWTGTSLQVRLMRGIFQPPLQASSSPIPGIQNYSVLCFVLLFSNLSIRRGAATDADERHQWRFVCIFIHQTCLLYDCASRRHQRFIQRNVAKFAQGSRIIIA